MKQFITIANADHGMDDHTDYVKKIIVDFLTNSNS